MSHLGWLFEVENRISPGHGNGDGWLELVKDCFIGVLGFTVVVGVGPPSVRPVIPEVEADNLL